MLADEFPVDAESSVLRRKFAFSVGNDPNRMPWRRMRNIATFNGGSDMSFVEGKHIVVTGGAGFLGREVCAELKLFSPASVFVPLSKDYDLREKSAICRLFEHVPDIVIHLAAVAGGIGANRDNPGRFFYENAIMGIELMEQARLCGVKKFVVVGSICSYPKFTPVPFREDDLWNGYPEETNAPYGLAKKMLVVQAQAYRQQYGFDAISLLLVNLYGPADNYDLHTSHVIPALIRKVVEAQQAQCDWIDAWGTGSVSREFLFVRDAARAIVLATDRYNRPDPVNLGSGMEINIRELAELILELCDFHGEIRWDSSKPDGQPRRCLDTTRACDAFGFKSQTSLRDGLMETITSYRQQVASCPLA